MTKKRIGIIGYGGRISGMLGLLLELMPEAQLAAITELPEAEEKVKKRLADNKIDSVSVQFYTEADEMLAKANLDGVMIGTRCSLHTKMAIKVLSTGLPLFLEKPVSTTVEDWKLLKAAAGKTASKTVVSFPLRVTPIALKAGEIINSGILGSIEHVQAWNNVPYGGTYFHNWYRDENETNGLFLQKATHDFDYICNLVNKKPVLICAMKSKQIFKGSRPSGLRCVDCPDKDICTEGPYQMKYVKYDVPNGEYCCFAVDTGNEDSGSAIFSFEDGSHCSYSQNFFARKKAAARGARFLGYNGTLEFDWYTDEIRVFMHNTLRNDVYQFDSVKMSHAGGDPNLIISFRDILRSKSEISVAPLEAGLQSAWMCLQARESAETQTFRTLV